MPQAMEARPRILTSKGVNENFMSKLLFLCSKKDLRTHLNLATKASVAKTAARPAPANSMFL